MKLSKCAQRWYWLSVLQLRSGQTAVSWCHDHGIERKSLGRWKSYFSAGELNLYPCVSDEEILKELAQLQSRKCVHSKESYTKENLSPYQEIQVKFVEVKIKGDASDV